MGNLTFKTKADFGKIGGNKKLTFTSWNGGDYKFDIRDWYDNGNVGKGITLTKEELKSLYDLLLGMEDKEEDKTDDNTDCDFSSLFEVENNETKEDDASNDMTLFASETSEKTFPDKIQKIFDALDKMFDGFVTEKDYGKMPFADGDRLQYYVKLGNKKLPVIKEADLKELGVSHFITNKGNLYIYTL